MSALLHLGEAHHRLLNADAELNAQIAPDADVRGEDELHLNEALKRARNEIAEARAAIAAVQLAMRTHALVDVLRNLEELAAYQANEARHMPVVRAIATKTAAKAKALRDLIGSGIEVTGDGTGTPLPPAPIDPRLITLQPYQRAVFEAGRHEKGYRR